MLPGDLKAVVFDLYNTVVRVPESDRSAHSATLAAQLGIAPRAFVDAWEATSRDSNTGAIATTEDRFDRVIAMTDATLKGATLEQLADAEHEFLRRTSRIVPGITEFLLRLRELGIRTWILSNCSLSAEHTLAATGITGLVDGQTLSYEVGSVKPERPIFEHALSRMRIPARACTYVADGQDGELEAARELGMDTVRVKWAMDSGTSPQGTPVVATVADLAASLELRPAL